MRDVGARRGCEAWVRAVGQTPYTPHPGFASINNELETSTTLWMDRKMLFSAKA